MAGHSHFKNMMHRKGRADKIRSKLFTKLSREITVSAKLGSPDPEMNPRLRASVSYQFEQIGQIKIKKELMSSNEALELAINAGAEDCITTDLNHEINCKKEEFNSVREEIEKKVKDLTFAGLIWNPLNKINLEKETFTKLVNFLEQIEDDDDVQNVFTNFEVDEKLLEGVN